jgi:polyhydroxyalkanoate synthase
MLKPPIPPNIDPFDITTAFTDLNGAWEKNRKAFAQCCRSLEASMQSTHKRVYRHLTEAGSEKTADSSSDLLMHWINAFAWTSKQYHQTLCSWMTHYVDNAPDVSPESRHKARFWIKQIQAMMEPANFFWTNPKAVRRFVKSKGESLNQGMRNWTDDLETQHGLVSLADQNSFQVGKNLATTPGKVIFRNQLMELIQYSPQSEKVWKIPIVLIQPWINKFYIFDLSPRNSFVAFLVRQGFTVFITSWKNPGPQMRHTRFEDYLRKGALQAVNTARNICNSSQVHLAGYCIGGTLAATLMGWLAHDNGTSPVADATLFSTLLDFSNPGELRAIIHPEAIKALEGLMAENGVLAKQHIATAFRLLNPNDLIWRYVVNNYFFGEPPPRSDMLYWNSDSTNLPEAMCTFFLKSFYQQNLIVTPNAMTLDGRPIDLTQIKAPFYIVGAEKDHICPWTGTFQSCGLVSGKVRYVLADEGHITGIVNPPSPWSKKKYRSGPATRLRNSEKWFHKQPRKDGSWWTDWIDWLKPRSGNQVPPPAMGSTAHPPICEAPGIYVHE